MRASSFFIIVGLIWLFWVVGLPIISIFIGMFALVNVIETDLDRRTNRQ